MYLKVNFFFHVRWCMCCLELTNLWKWFMDCLPKYYNLCDFVNLCDITHNIFCFIILIFIQQWQNIFMWIILKCMVLCILLTHVLLISQGYIKNSSSIIKLKIIKRNLNILNSQTNCIIHSFILFDTLGFRFY